ncbi:MAG: prephenate dehydrogenase/arogenate dehydrogenase family protein [Clostridia bacterium]|nr:prephenate dehydrogenase/arogenate dehydrogenase family protein [Clostridia bacterium]
MNIGIVGLGLIGGSLAKSIKENTAHTVFGYDIDDSVVQKALLCEAIDERLSADILPSCDIILVALYPSLCVEYIKEHADMFASHALVVDCAGVKRAVYAPIRQIAANYEWQYIGGHPMAGREYSGFNHAQGDLFQNASMILTPGEDLLMETRAKLKAFFLEAGFASVRFTSAEEHDSMIAYTSQLAHIVSGAYVKNPLSQQHKGFSAGSFQDMTRVARLNEKMWTELMMDNADLLVPSLDDFIMRLSQYRDALAERNSDALFELLKEGRIMKENLIK